MCFALLHFCAQHYSMRPWPCSQLPACPVSHAGSLWAAFADRTGWHKPLLLAASILQLLGRSSAALVHTFPGLVVLVVVTEGLGSPVTILSDIAIMTAAEDVRLRMLFAA